jgi:hypothetical protein
MPGRRFIVTILLALAYFVAAYGDSLLFMMPSIGSGIPAVRKASGHHQEARRQNWTHRGHLPLVKFISFDQISAIPHVPAFRTFWTMHGPLKSAFNRDQHFGSPMCNRGPPGI